MEIVTVKEAKIAGDGSKLDALFVSLRKWLVFASEGMNVNQAITGGNCALCIYYKSSCKLNSGELCPLKGEGTDVGACCESYGRAFKASRFTGNEEKFKEYAVELSNTIMKAISDELESLVKNVKKPDVVHRIGNKYTRYGCSDEKHEWVLVCISYKKACLINTTNGMRYTDGHHVESMSYLTKDEWARVNYDGKMTLVK